MKKLRKTDVHLIELVQKLRYKSYEANAPIWKTIADRLSSSRKNYAVVNVGKLSSLAVENGVYIVPGMLLGGGQVTKKMKVAAYKVSKTAQKKIEAAGGDVMSILQLLSEQPDGRNIRIIG